MNWLIVEDEADIRNLVAMMCQVWGNTPMTYESGQKAWDWLDEIEAGSYTGPMPDFALMDIRMPGKRGFEISQRIRTIPALQNIPIVLMTAFVMSEEEMGKMRRDFGVDAVINKPLPDFDRLRTMLYEIIDKKKAEVSAKAATVPSKKTTDEVAQVDPGIDAETLPSGASSTTTTVTESESSQTPKEETTETPSEEPKSSAPEEQPTENPSEENNDNKPTT
ncbi:MAG: response regulator [Chloroflexi bacterium]|nr:MAG: response regulator [Chloroflexota bacterium]